MSIGKLLAVLASLSLSISSFGTNASLGRVLKKSSALFTFIGLSVHEACQLLRKKVCHVDNSVGKCSPGQYNAELIADTIVNYTPGFDDSSIIKGGTGGRSKAIYSYALAFLFLLDSWAFVEPDCKGCQKCVHDH